MKVFSRTRRISVRLSHNLAIKLFPVFGFSYHTHTIKFVAQTFSVFCLQILNELHIVYVLYVYIHIHTIYIKSHNVWKSNQFIINALLHTQYFCWFYFCNAKHIRFVYGFLILVARWLNYVYVFRQWATHPTDKIWKI